MTLLLFVIGVLVYFAIGIAIAGFAMSATDGLMDDEDVVEIVLAWPIIVCATVAYVFFKLVIRAVRFVALLVRRILRR